MACREPHLSAGGLAAAGAAPPAGLAAVSSIVSTNEPRKGAGLCM